MPDGPRYDDDFYAWTKYQAKVLRDMRVEDNRFDRANLVEKIRRRDVRRRLPLLYRPARRLAELSLLSQGASAAASLLPEICPFTIGDVLRDQWYPQPMETAK